MQYSGVLVILLAVGSNATSLRARQEPDTSCGKGFESLVPGSQAYYKTASIALWTHPYHTADNVTFDKEFQCWFANMNTQKCGGFESQRKARNAKLSEACLAPTVDWMPVYKLFSAGEFKWFKNNFPSMGITTSSNVDGENNQMSGKIADSRVSYKMAMETAMVSNKKEALCLTLFTIDDDCVKWDHIRTADGAFNMAKADKRL